MNDQLKTLRNTPLPVIGGALQQHAEALLDEWLNSAQILFPSANHKRRNDIRNDLMLFVRRLGQAIASRDDPIALHNVACSHGQQRWVLGWQLDEVVMDYQLLRLIITQNLDGLLGRAMNLDEHLALDLYFDDAIQASVVSYSEYRMQEKEAAQHRLVHSLAVLAHELRSPLSAMYNAVQLQKLDLDQHGTRTVQILDSQLQQIVRLVEDLGDAPRTLQGHVQLAWTPLELQAIIQEAANTVRHVLDENNHCLELNLPDNPLPLQGDALRLRQVFVNLLNNAIKYTDPGGKITITVEHDSGYAITHIHDDGIGISPEFLPQIFEPFVQDSKHRQEGLGLGLALVDKLVNLHHGSISASSEGTGQGSEFVVSLPLLTAPEKTTTVGPQEQHSVLVVEMANTANGLTNQLTSLGYRVTRAADSDYALRYTSNESFQAVVVDFDCTHLDPIQLGHQLIAQNTSTPLALIAVSHHLDHLPALSRQAGYIALLLRPLDGKLFARALEAVVQPDDQPLSSD